MKLVPVPLPLPVLVWIASKVGAPATPLSLELDGVIYKLYARR